MTTAGHRTGTEDPGRAAFFQAATTILDRSGITTSTMMGLACLRLHGYFFAAYDHRTGDLLIKLDRDEVDRMVDAGEGHSFAPAGRRFREWIAVPPDRQTAWPALIAQAHASAASRLGEPPGRILGDDLERSTFAGAMWSSVHHGN